MGTSYDCVHFDDKALNRRCPLPGKSECNKAHIWMGPLHFSNTQGTAWGSTIYINHYYDQH